MYKFLIGLMFSVVLLSSCKRSSNELLEAFGTINEKLDVANSRNLLNIDSVFVSRPELAKKYAIKIKNTQEVYIALDNYLTEIKSEVLQTIGTLDYELMDKSTVIDTLFFKNEIIRPKGQQFIDKIEEYKKAISFNFKKDFPEIVTRTENIFNTNAIETSSGTINWLEYHFKNFPMVASIARFSSLQNDLKLNQREVYRAIISKADM